MQFAFVLSLLSFKKIIHALNRRLSKSYDESLYIR